MPRPPTLNPIGVFDHPNLVQNPARQAQIINSFVARLEYLRRTYSLTTYAIDREGRSFNASLKRLKDHVRSLQKGTPQVFEQSAATRLHPELELLINIRARHLADIEPGQELGPQHQCFVDAAAIEIASTMRARRGRPKRAVLRYFVEGLVALIIEVTGRPVIGQRSKGSVYEPSLDEPSGQVIRDFVNLVEPGVSDITIVDMLRLIRQDYAGKEMRFDALFPFYGGGIEEGVPRPGRGHRLETFIQTYPIYCP